MSRCFSQCRESILRRTVLTRSGQGLHRRSLRCLHTYLSLTFSQVPRHHQPRNPDKRQVRKQSLFLPLLTHNHHHHLPCRKTIRKHQPLPVLSPFQQVNKRALHPQNRVSGRPGPLLTAVVLSFHIYPVPLKKKRKKTQPRTIRSTTLTTFSFLRMSPSGKDQIWHTEPVRLPPPFPYLQQKMVWLTLTAC